MSAKREPVRSCLGCRSRKGRAELQRLALEMTSEGAILRRDEKGLRPGRGAWICRGAEAGLNEKCFQAAVRKNAFGRAFRYTGLIDRRDFEMEIAK